ncbi:OPT oligopeptide transporter [Guyanagaster necrorhizus]|uniref:OPT oligopeptide transporter n=1 Tax=Guyanagaster necrorhizus TaxID=856835 RepID=A0A9P8ALV2_9AGAR|nr:OPT oligopeptide transporter [Guyanagaster necrorhizus MCA 3950]KAG7440074.1 OPT oligopeptide transporter [Guyanagaster necrorhizus MCA 3950]
MTSSCAETLSNLVIMGDHPVRGPHYSLAKLNRPNSYAPSTIPDVEKDEDETYQQQETMTVQAITGAQFDDPNLDRDHMLVFDDDSPYPEVRSAVSNTDDPDMPVATLRAWIIGLMWAILIPGINQFFFFRYPNVYVTGIIAQLLSFPIGQVAAAYVPRWKVFGISLNPSPFTVKEHVLITIMASVGAGSAYATDIIVVQRVYYNQIYSFSYQWFIVMSTQIIGYAIGGVARRFLVAPPSMIWPAKLVNCALFNTLHSQQYAGIGNRGGINRERFFVYAFLAAFAWYFFPGYLFQALSYFSWITWIKPNDAVLAQLFGYIHGLGLSVVTFDWSQIAYIGSPLATPWWAEANIFTGFVFFFWILTPILYFTDTWHAKYMPISSRSSYDNQMREYNVTRILRQNSTFNADAYHEYSPLFISTTFAISYGLSFAAITATIMHAILFFRKQIWIQSCRALHEQPDIHSRLMSKYKQVPEWWYLGIFFTMFVLGVISIEVWPTEMPVWAFLLALVIAFTYVIPVGMIQAITNQQVGTNVITELVIGYARPGRPVAMMMFKTWGYITMSQALTFTSDFKLGHYMKIPPRSMFWAQVIATTVAGTVQLGVQSWMFTNIEGMCSPDQKDGFICPGTEVFGTASIIWGVIGPGLQFSKGQTYYPLVYFFLIGAIAPLVIYFVGRRYPSSWLRYVNPVIFNGTGLIPPATSINYVPWAAVGMLFQYYIRRRHFSWWTKYNYVLSAALDAGTTVSIIVIFFCLQYPRNGTIGLDTIQSWWGNTVPFKGADYGPGGIGTPVKALAPGETFGPSMW